MSSGNPLGLVGAAESALVALALKFELVCGVQVDWRHDENAIRRMVQISCNSEQQELRSKAEGFLRSITPEAREFLGLGELKRGDAAMASPEKRQPVAGPGAGTQGQKRHVYRGRVYYK